MRTVTMPVAAFALAAVSEIPDDDPERLWQAAAEVLLASGEHRALAALSDTMLAHFPHHLDALYYRARLAMARGDHPAALPLLERVLKGDPEHWAARYAYGTLLLSVESTAKAGMARCLEAVTQGATLKPQVSKSLPTTFAPRGAPPRPASMQAQWEQAYQEVLSSAGTAVPESYTDLFRELLVAMLMLESLGAGGALGSGRRVAHKLEEEQPALVKPRMLLAQWYSDEQDIATAMRYLHDARVLDPGGRVARRLALPMLTIAYSRPLPAAVAETLDRLPADVRGAAEQLRGWQAPAPLDKQLLVSKRVGSSARRNAPALTPSPVASRLQHDLIRWQQRLLAPKSQRTQVPTAEIIVTARQPWVKLYGVAAAETILEETARLVAAINQTNRIHAHLVVLDDVESVKSWGAERVEPGHAASVKKVIDRVDEKIEAGGEQANFVLIVGGDDVVPFHRLPNPVEDDDPHVPSDNPYGTSGDSYLIPTRAVGRLPHDRSSPDLILAQLRRLQAAWRASTPGSKGGWVGKLNRRPATGTKGEGFGYSAEVWGAAAKEVYKVLDSKGEMRLSPPHTQQRVTQEPLPALPFYYFNLHGVDSNGNYYGHASDVRTNPDQLYPVALTPSQFASLELEKAVIFSEACYGTNPAAVTVGESMALTALSRGALLFVGSTNLAYGSFKPPLMAADLLAAYFWQAIGEGLPGGAALQQAKIELARTMSNPGDYVDLEEQKALLSFVLYGDPALPPDNRPRNPDVSVLRKSAQKAITESRYQISAKNVPSQTLDPALQKIVKAYVAPFTPGAGGTPRIRARPVSLTDAPPTLASYFSSGASLPRTGVKGAANMKERWHVTVSQPVSKNGVLHRHVITLTMDEHGKVVKSHTSK